MLPDTPQTRRHIYPEHVIWSSSERDLRLFYVCVCVCVWQDPLEMGDTVLLGIHFLFKQIHLVGMFLVHSVFIYLFESLYIKTHSDLLCTLLYETCTRPEAARCVLPSELWSHRMVCYVNGKKGKLVAGGRGCVNMAAQHLSC